MPVNARCSIANCDIFSSAPLPWAGDTPPPPPHCLWSRGGGVFSWLRKRNVPFPPRLWGHTICRNGQTLRVCEGPPAPSTTPILFGREVSPGDKILQRTSLRTRGSWAGGFLPSAFLLRTGGVLRSAQGVLRKGRAQKAGSPLVITSCLPVNVTGAVSREPGTSPPLPSTSGFPVCFL